MGMELGARAVCGRFGASAGLETTSSRGSLWSAGRRFSLWKVAATFACVPDAEVAALYTPQSPHRPYGLTASILYTHNAKAGSSRESLGAEARTGAASPALSSKIHVSGTSLSYGGFPRARGARLWLSTTSPSLSPQVAPQATPPARQPTSAKEFTSLMIRQMFLRLYTCCYLCGASTPRQMWRNIYRCLPYFSSADVPR